MTPQGPGESCTVRYPGPLSVSAYCQDLTIVFVWFSVLNDGFMKYVESFMPFLVMGLRNIEEHQVCTLYCPAGDLDLGHDTSVRMYPGPSAHPPLDIKLPRKWDVYSCYSIIIRFAKLLMELWVTCVVRLAHRYYRTAMIYLSYCSKT